MSYLTDADTRKKFLRTFVLSLAVLGIAAVACASEGGGGAHGGGGGHANTAAQMKDFIWRVVDFAVLAAILFWALAKQNVKSALKARQDEIEKSLQEAAEARDAAERKLREYTEKLESAHREIDEISAAIRREAERDRERIIADATSMAAKIREQAQQTAVQEIQKARAELRQEAARLAVELAEKKIRENITKSDQDRLVADYLTKVVEL